MSLFVDQKGQVHEVPGDEDPHQRVGQEGTGGAGLGERVEHVLETLLIDRVVHLDVADLREGEERGLTRPRALGWHRNRRRLRPR